MAVNDHGSIRAAARALHLTQAALTKSLRQLEESAGVALLLRQSRGVKLTEHGTRLHQRAQLVVSQIQLAQDELRHLQGLETGTVRAGLTPYLMLTAAGEAFKWFRKRYPGVSLSLVEGLVSRVLPALRDGSLDFAIVADSGDVTDHEFEATPLQTLQQVLVVRSGHPLLAAPNVTALSLLEWVLPGPMAKELDRGMVELFARSHVAPPLRVTRCDALGALALVRLSDAVTIMPKPLLALPETHGSVSYTHLTLPLVMPDFEVPPVTLVLLTRPEVPLTPTAAYFSRCLMDANPAGVKAA